MLYSGSFSARNNVGYDLCHFILYSEIAGFAYGGLKYINPSNGHTIDPYTYSRYGLGPVSEQYDRYSNCTHDNIRGTIQFGGIVSKYQGREYFIDSYDGSPTGEHTIPGVVCWKADNGDFRSLPAINSTWSDGYPAYFTYMPERPIMYPLNQEVWQWNWRGERAYSVKFSGTTSHYDWSVHWDPNFVTRPDQFGSDDFVWDAERRMFYPRLGIPGNGCWGLCYPADMSNSRLFSLPIGAKDAFNAFLPTLRSMPDLDYTGLGPIRKAVESFNAFDINNVENASSFSLMDILPVEAILKFKKNPLKAVSDLYLWYKYSFCPNISDITQMCKNFSRALEPIDKRHKSYGTNNVSSDYLGFPINTRYNACVIGSLAGYTELQKVAQRLSSYGLSINAQNVWDIIPFSFIIDWFLPIGDILGDIDYRASVLFNKWNISLVEQSTRTQLDIPASSLFKGCQGAVQLIRYTRQYSRELPMNQFNFGSSDPLRHISEGAALIVSNW